MIPTDTLNKRHSIGSTVAMDVFEAAVNTGDVQQMKEAFKAIPSGQRHLVSNTNAAKLAVFIAAGHDDELLSILLDAHCSADYVDDKGETALHQAVKRDRPQSVQRLLEQETCLPNAADGHYQTALHRAGEFGYVECLTYLVNHVRVDIDAEDAWQRTALHWTAQKGLLEQTKILLMRGAKIVNTVTKETPLHWAVRGGHTDQVEILLLRRPELSVYALNDRMESPMQMANTLGFGDLILLLQQHAEAHHQVPPALNTVVNDVQTHEPIAINTMKMKPKGGVRKLTIKRLDEQQ